jgi:hypothetical protein
MTNYRLFLLNFLTVSWVFLCGFNPPVEHDMSPVEKQNLAVEPQSVETEHNRRLLETKQPKAKIIIKPAKANPHKTKATGADVANDNNPIKGNELEKPLDLSVQFEDPENADLKNEQKSAAQNGSANIFAQETKKKHRPLELDGGFLMSPEPEAEKQKSVDGAGIVIKLKP